MEVLENADSILSRVVPPEIEYTGCDPKLHLLVSLHFWSFQ